MDYKFFKRVFDLLVSLIMFLILSPLLLVLIIIAAFDTGSNGVFLQERVGQYGRLFKIFKIRTFHKNRHTVSNWGSFLRKSKLDELLQLINIIIGDMSFVGPRPDIVGYYDVLEGENKLILNLKPGITCEASIKYNNEEDILLEKDNPLKYNDEVIFPDKVKINLDYYYKRSFSLDLKILFKTFFKIL